MRFFFLAGILGLACVTRSKAADFCWVDHVYTQGDGVAVTFAYNARVRVYRPHAYLASERNVEYDRVKDGYQLFDADYKPKGAPVVAVPMNIDDQASLSNSPEDTCTITAARREGQVGIVASAFFFSNLPGVKPETREDFMAAEPVLVTLP